MRDYINVTSLEHRGKGFCVSFDIGNEVVMRIGNKIEEINEYGYMNGYNWDAFFNYYLSKYYPSILESMEGEPESGMYFAFFSEKDILKMKKFVNIIYYLIENEEEIYRIIREDGEYIEWD